MVLVYVHSRGGRPGSRGWASSDGCFTNNRRFTAKEVGYSVRVHVCVCLADMDTSSQPTASAWHCARGHRCSLLLQSRSLWSLIVTARHKLRSGFWG